jgi:hypothetical protein
MFWASVCPSSGEQEQDWLKLHVKMPGCAGCDNMYIILGVNFGDTHYIVNIPLPP